MEAAMADQVTISVYERLFNYKFDKQPRFINAWRKFKGFPSGDRLQETYIKVQVFFYSKEVEKVDLEGYQNWLKLTRKEVHVIDISNENVAMAESDKEKSCGSETWKTGDSSVKHPTTSVVDSSLNKAPELPEGQAVQPDIGPGESTDTNVEHKHRLAGKHPANFLELIEMIQCGLKLPDTEELNIEPTDEEPTPSEIARPKKPWES